MLLTLFEHKDRKLFLYLLLCAIMSTVILYFVESVRWQFLPALYLLPVTYIIHRVQSGRLRSHFKILLSVWFIIALILPWAIPIFKLSKPGGKYAVGTETFHWVDSSRTEWFTNEDPNDKRQIMVQIWYPGENKQDSKPEAYMDFIQLRSKTLASAGKLPSFFPSHLDLIKTHSYLNIDFIKKDSVSPVLIFSHGITGSANFTYCSITSSGSTKFPPIINNLKM